MHALVDSIKAFLYKTDFDWDGEITLQTFHPQLRILLAINGVFFNNRESNIRFIWPVLSTLITLVAVAFEMFFIWHGIDVKDYTFATESFCYFFILGVVGIVYSSVLMNRPKVFKLLYNMNNDFLSICELRAEFRDNFLSGQLLIWRLCWSWIAFISFVSGLYIANTLLYLLYQSTLATQDEHMTRPLIFPMWLPEDDPYRTPNYEIFISLEIILIYVVVLTFGVYVYILFHLLLHYYMLMDVIMMALDELFKGLDESVMGLSREEPRREAVQNELNTRMRRIVHWHLSIFESVDDISSVYGPTLVYQVMFSSIVICLVAYQVAEQLSEGKLDYLFGLLGIGACLQLWIPCYIGTLLRNKGFFLGERCFYCGWDETPLSRMLRMDLIIFIQRTQRPVAIKFTGLPHLQLETFSSEGGSSGGVGVNYIARKGGTVLLYNGHQYYKNSKYKNGSELWRCSSFKKLKCTGFITVNIMSNAYSLFNMLRQYN